MKKIDNRKNLFCKIDPEVKAKLDEMAYGTTMKKGELIAWLIADEYKRHSKRMIKLADEFTNNG